MMNLCAKVKFPHTGQAPFIYHLDDLRSKGMNLVKVFLSLSAYWKADLSAFFSSKWFLSDLDDFGMIHFHVTTCAGKSEV